LKARVSSFIVVWEYADALTYIDDFEVAIFLTDTSTRHSLLTKTKYFKEQKDGIQSNSNKLTGTDDAPIYVEDVVVHDESDQEISLSEIPPPSSVDTRRSARLQALDNTISFSSNDGVEMEIRPSKRGRRDSIDGLFVNSDEEDDGFPPAKKAREVGEEGDDDKKKMAMDTRYDGFSIHGKVLSLVVKKRDSRAKAPGPAMMEDWITSTQVPLEHY
jgi:hypothetical protein